MFIFISYSAVILLAGVRAESRDGRTAVVASDFYTLISTNAIDETALWVSELSKFAHY